MKKAFLAAMLAVAIGAAASPAYARGEGSVMVDPNPVPAWLHDATPQEPHAPIASRRFADLANRWIAEQNSTQSADLGDG